MCVVKDPETRKMTRLKDISAQMLKVFLNAVTRPVEDKVTAQIKDAKIGIMFDD